MRAQHRAITALLLLSSLARGQDPLDPAAASRRLSLIALGSYQLKQSGAAPAGPEDVGLCLRFLAHDNDELVAKACLASSALVDLPFFPEVPKAQRRELASAVIARLDTEYGALAEAAYRALRAMIRREHLEPSELRTAVVVALASILRDDPEVRRRAGLLLADVVDSADENLQQQIARTVLLAFDRRPRTDAEERADVARTVLASVLCRVETRDPKLADELAGRFLEDLATGVAYGFRYQRGDVLRGLGRVFVMLQGSRRTAALDALRRAVGDPELQFMRTSGVRTPLHHHGHEAVALAAPGLTAEELACVVTATEAARRRAEAAGAESADLAGMYDVLERAIAARRRALGQ